MKKKIPILILLQAIGLTQKKIFYSTKNCSNLIPSFTNSKIKKTKKALIKLSKILSQKNSNIVRIKIKK